MMTRPVRRLALFLATLGWADALWASPEETVVIANANSADSIALAAHYARVRGIPDTRVIRLGLPVVETMTREDYEQHLRDPLLAALRDAGLIEQSVRPPEEVRAHESSWRTDVCRLRYLVCVRGVPLRIADTGSLIAATVRRKMGVNSFDEDTAAVDSELALVLKHDYPVNRLVPNPFFQQLGWPQTGSPDQNNVLLAARLDGPDIDQIHRQIDETVAAERYGLLGYAYFDLRGLTDSPHGVGDVWIAEAYQRMLREGYECIVNADSDLFPPDFPMEHVAFYMGWYEEHAAGPFARDGFRFMPGAVAYHIHSLSAVTLRSHDRHWAGPLLSRGAVATMGAVHEPYLEYTPRPDLFTRRLCSGLTFGESAHLAQMLLSWQIAVVGDPLYRPFRYSVDEQIEHLEADEHEGVEWGYLRKCNLLVRQGRYHTAVALCREQIDATGSVVLRERLADLHLLNNQFTDASDAYSGILADEPGAVTAIRVGRKLIEALDASGQPGRADAVLGDLQTRWEDHPVGAWLDQPRNVVEARE